MLSLFHYRVQELIRKIADIYTGGSAIPEVDGYDGNEVVAVYKGGHVRRATLQGIVADLVTGAQEPETFDITDGIKGAVADGTIFYTRSPFPFEMQTGVADVDTTPAVEGTIDILRNGVSIGSIVITNPDLTGALVLVDDDGLFADGDVVEITASGFTEDNLRYTIYGEKL